jgi:hypothetical protein
VRTKTKFACDSNTRSNAKLLSCLVKRVRFSRSFSVWFFRLLSEI